MAKHRICRKPFWQNRKVRVLPREKRAQEIMWSHDFEYWAGTRPGGNGEQAAAPRPSAITDAINFVANLGLDPAFSAALEPDGAVELVLGSAGIRLVLVFEGDSKVHVHTRRPGQEMAHTERDIPTFIGNGEQIEQTLQSFDRVA